MRVSIWDILTIGVIVILAGVAVVFGIIFMNPQNALNPLPPPALPPTVMIPTSTATLQSLPSTWTPAAPTPSETPRASSTPAPTSTIFMLPSATPTATVTKTNLPSGTPLPFRCSLVSASPENGTRFNKGDDFDARWTIKNTGTATLKSSDVDLRYLRGDQLQKREDALDFEKNLGAGGTRDFVLDMHAPGSEGTYTATWGVTMGDRVICSWTISIVVK